MVIFKYLKATAKSIEGDILFVVMCYEIISITNKKKLKRAFKMKFNEHRHIDLCLMLQIKTKKLLLVSL